MDDIIKTIETILKSESSMDFFLAIFIASGVIMFSPINVLFSYPSKEIIGACEYMKYTPHFFVFSSAIIGVKIYRWIQEMISKQISDYVDGRKVKKARLNYLLSLDIVRISIISNFYNRKYYIDRLPKDIVTDELLYHDVINYAQNSDFNWDKKDNFVLNQWVIDELTRNEEVKKYFFRVLHQSEERK